MSENNNNVETDGGNESITDIIDAVGRLPEGVTDLITKYTDISARNNITGSTVLRRRQLGSYVIIVLTVCSVSGLAYAGAIDGSAVAGILGAVVGHIFSNANRG